MSSSSHAFTKKLRSAIKTKIQEYGVDADDELPDYVMVLAANRKDKQQMKTDLQLFLGKHTNSFVEWLFDAFDRLQKAENKEEKELKSNVVESEKRDQRSSSIETLSPPRARLRSKVVVVEGKPKRLSPKYRSSRKDDRHIERTHRNRNNKDVDSDDEPIRQKSVKRISKPLLSPKIHYDDEAKPSPSKISHDEEILMVGNDDRQKTRRFTIKVGDKQFLRLTDPLKVETTRKRRSDDPALAATKILNDQIQKISHLKSDKKARIQTEENDNVEPYSPAPIQKTNESDDEKKIDLLLKSVQEQAFYQHQMYLMPKERCQYWPDCAKGNQCQFFHPNRVCKLFPNCLYGSQCLNIHPICHYNGRCTRENCPYTHSKALKKDNHPSNNQLNTDSTENGSDLSSAHGPIPCKYKGRCAKITCGFWHPKQCRYGLNCKNKDNGCLFSHYKFEKPDLSKFQWKAEKH